MSSGAVYDPKRRDAARTKAAILAAAQTAFSARGYAQTGIREIAGLAGVNSSLVARYFGSKEALFVAALKDALDLADLLSAGRSGFGRHVANMLNRADASVDSLSMMILASADPDARAAAIGLLDQRVIETLAAWIGPPDAEARAAQITILCSGFVAYRRLLPIGALTPGRGDKALDWLAGALQAIVDG